MTARVIDDGQEELRWQEAFRARFGRFPIAGGTNVASTLTDSGPGHISGYYSWTISATNFSGVDLAGCGSGAQLRPYHWLRIYRNSEGFAYRLRSRMQTCYERQAFPDYVYNDGEGGTRRLALPDGSDVPQLFAPWDWLDPFENLVSDAPPPPPPTIADASMADIDRDWDAPYQDIAVTFSAAVEITPAPGVGDTIAGLTAQVNGGGNAALTYRSGNGTTSWKVRRAELIQQDDSVVLDYSQAAGAILSVAGGVELEETVDAPVTNNLTKRVRAILKDKNNALVASETVKYAICEYDSGAPANANWMSRTTKGTAATTAAGLLDVEYTGSTAVGSTIYLAVIRPDTTPTESALWHQAVD